MHIKVLAFGIAKQIVGQAESVFEIPEPATIADLKQEILAQFPDFEKLVSLRVAINAEYAADDTLLKPQDEVVLIPPVSGG